MVILVVLTGCTGAAATPTPDAFQSGGLGLTKGEWERQHHKLTSVDYLSSFYFYDYENLQSGASGYAVRFWSEDAQLTNETLISSIGVDVRFVLSGTDGLNIEAYLLTPDQKHKAVSTLLPADTQFQRRIDQFEVQGSYSDIYYSKSLAGRYPPLPSVGDPWGKDPPGTIRASYYQAGPGVSISAGSKRPPSLPTPTSPAPTETETPLPVPSPVPTTSRSEPLPPPPVRTGGPPPRAVPTGVAP